MTYPTDCSHECQELIKAVRGFRPDCSAAEAIAQAVVEMIATLNVDREEALNCLDVARDVVASEHGRAA